MSNVSETMSIIVELVPGNRGVSHCNHGLELSVQPTTTPFTPVGESVSFRCLNRSTSISSHLPTSVLSPRSRTKQVPFSYVSKDDGRE